MFYFIHFEYFMIPCKYNVHEMYILDLRVYFGSSLIIMVLSQRNFNPLNRFQSTDYYHRTLYSCPLVEVRLEVGVSV